MGDAIEFITWPQHQHIFYKITSGAIAFSVIGERHAAVGLAKKPGEKCEYWIVIGRGQCWLEKDGSRTSNLRDMPNILSNDVRNRFWITWHSSRLQFGKISDGIPLISKKISSLDIHYVTFSVYADRGTLLWKLYLPPTLIRPVIKQVKKGGMEWIDGDTQLPDGALIGGYDKEILYIIRARHRGSLTPGKFVPSQGLGFIPWGGEMHEMEDFEVLCGYNCIWISTSGNKIPVGAVEGGYSEDNHEVLYVGRAFEEGNLIPGKVQPSHSVCYIPHNDREIGKKDYEILVNPHTAMNSPNRYFVTHMEHLAANQPELDPDHAHLNMLWGHESSEHTSESE